MAHGFATQSKADGDVVSASVDVSRQAAGSASDPEYAGQWAMPKIGWEDVHDVATYSGSTTLAVLDTGVDASAPDLAGRVGAGWSFDASDPTTDVNGHGTHTATFAADNSRGPGTSEGTSDEIAGRVVETAEVATTAPA